MGTNSLTEGKEKQISKRRRYKMGKRFYAVLVLAGLMALGTGIGYAAFEVTNTAELAYYSNWQQTFKYGMTDTAAIRVLFGPQMTLAKNVQNVITSESSADKVLASKGDTVMFVLYAHNDQSQADTAAWHVVIADTFTMNSATVGPNPVTDSFTYVAGSETSVSGESYTIADSIAYYNGTNWVGLAGGIVTLTNPSDTEWIPYAGNHEANAPGGLAANIRGIAWYFRRVGCIKDAYGADNSGIESRYKIQTSFKLFKNNN